MTGSPGPREPTLALTEGFSSHICAACHLGDHRNCTGTSRSKPCQCGHYEEIRR